MSELENKGTVVQQVNTIGPCFEEEAFKKFGSPLEDLSRPLPYCELQTMFDNPFRVGLQSYWKASFTGTPSMKQEEKGLRGWVVVERRRALCYNRATHTAT